MTLLRKSFTRIASDAHLPPDIARLASWVPLLEIRVEALGRKTPAFDAIVDSGSPYCIFRGGIAEFLGLDLKAGVYSTVFGASERIEVPVFFHEVRLRVESQWQYKIQAGFVEDLAFPGILGMAGFFEKFRVNFDLSQPIPAFEIHPIESAVGPGVH